jgi:hypothetical protein
MKTIILNLVQSFASILKVIILSKFNNVLRLKVNSNKDCIILGNGPSLTNSLHKYKNALKNYDLICVNNFVKSEFFYDIKPNFYIFSATILFKPENELSNSYIELRDEIFNNLKQKTNWKINLMVPFEARKSPYFKKFISENHFFNPIYFNTTPVEGLKFINNLLFKFGLGMPRPHNVLIPAIMNCIHLSYKNIYILGADHSWLNEISVNQKNEALVNQKHFYDLNESKPLKMEDYISRPRLLHEIIHKFYHTFKGYWEIKQYANFRNINIYNSSEYSMIDAFEKKEILIELICTK